MRLIKFLLFLLYLSLLACGGGGSSSVVSTGTGNTGTDATNNTNNENTSGSDSSSGDTNAGDVTPLADAGKSTIIATKTFIDQDIESTTTITVQLKDSAGTNLINGGDTLALVSTAGSIGPVTDKGDGSYSAVLTANANLTAITVTAKVNGVELTDSERIAVKVSVATDASALAILGEAIFRDTNLSTPPGQSCETCHAIDTGSSHDSRVNNQTSAGSNDIFGGRNTPAINYAAQIPDQFLEGLNPVGGQFWDGRAESLEEQARQPFLEPLEMNNPDQATLINKIKSASYANVF